MAMTCRGILALPYANRLRLVAGASGGGNEIRWVHILEEPKYTAWLKGGELILLSGVVTGDREGALLSLLQDLFDREVAGVVLNLSTFLPAIPPSVLALGDRLGLPLFEMPAEVRMVDVSQSIAFAIFQQRQKTGQVEGPCGTCSPASACQRSASSGWPRWAWGAGGPSGRSSSARGCRGRPRR